MERDKAVHRKADFMGTWNSSQGQGNLNNFMSRQFTNSDSLNNFPEKLPTNFSKFFTTKDADAAGAEVKIYRPLTQQFTENLDKITPKTTGSKCNTKAMVQEHMHYPDVVYICFEGV